MGGKGDRGDTEENRRIYGRQGGDRGETEPPFQGLPVPSCLLHCHTLEPDFPCVSPLSPPESRDRGVLVGRPECNPQCSLAGGIDDLIRVPTRKADVEGSLPLQSSFQVAFQFSLKRSFFLGFINQSQRHTDPPPAGRPENT